METMPDFIGQSGQKRMVIKVDGRMKVDFRLATGFWFKIALIM